MLAACASDGETAAGDGTPVPVAGSDALGGAPDSPQESVNGGPLSSWLYGNDKPREKQATQIRVRESKAAETERLGNPRLLLAAGYVRSNWKAIDSGFKNGSLDLKLGALRNYAWWLDAGLSLELLEGSDGSNSNSNIYAMLVNAEARQRFLSGRLRPYLGASLGFGSFRAWSLVSETASQITLKKVDSGYLCGFTPAIGLGFDLARRFGLEIEARYPLFLGGQARHLRGPGVMATISIARD